MAYRATSAAEPRYLSRDVAVHQSHRQVQHAFKVGRPLVDGESRDFLNASAYPCSR